MTAWYIGRNKFRFDVVDSTSETLRLLMRETHLSEGTAVIADYQEKGRGQRNTQWESEPGKNLLCSVVLYPTFLKADQQFTLSQCAALAVADTILEAAPGAEAAVKWPNDIWVGRDKISGILIENVVQGSNLVSSIIGIGLNVNEKMPAGRTSLAEVSGKEFRLPEVEKMIFTNLERRYEQLRSGKLNSIQINYMNLLYGIGKELLFKDNIGNYEFHGIITSINSTGKLQVLTTDGVREFDLKEISFL